MRDLGHLAALGALGLDKVSDKLLGEYASCGEVVVIFLERGESLLERGGKSLELCFFLLGKVEEVEVIGSPAVCVGVYLVLDTVETRHKDRGIAEVGVAGRIGVTKFEAALLGRLCVCGDTDDRASVRGRVADRNGCLEAGNESLEGVGAGVGECAEGCDMLEKSAHEVMRGLGKVRVAVVIREHGLAVLHQEHMNVHSAACFAIDGLGHKGCGLAILECGVVDDVLDHHSSIRHMNDLAELGFDLELTGCGDLGMVVIDLDAHFLHKKAHLTARFI